jgi:sugar phosphate isomerase/epimerase
MTLSRLSPFGLGTAAVLVVASHNAFPVPPIPDDYHVGGFAVGCQAWTFKSFTVLETIEKTAQAGGKVIEFFPGQKLSKDEPTAKFDHNASDETIRQVKDHLAKNKVLPVNYGVVGAKGEAEWRKIFEFAKKLGLYGITTEAVGDLETIEKLVKEFDIAVGIHQHPKRPNDPNYKVWDPAYVLSVVQDRDPRIGACADTGHWATSGVNPLDAIKLLRGRIISLHLKERDQIGQLGTDLIFGTGITDTKAILDELKRQGFKGNISIEYETNWENSVPDVAQCVGFIRGLGRCPK